MKLRFNKLRICILFVHLYLLSLAIYCTITYNREKKVAATTEPFFFYYCPLNIEGPLTN